MNNTAAAGTVTSAKTGDMGVALYAGMAVMSLLGSGYVVNRRKNG